MRRKFILVLSFLLLLYSTSQAGEKKPLVALIDFTDETPNKMAIDPEDKVDINKVYLSEVMQVIRELTEKSDLFELLPHNTVTEAMKTQIGKEAIARRYDRFSSVRLGKMLGVDAIFTGEILHFEKNIIPRDFIIDGLDISNRAADVVIRARLINANNGERLAEVSGSGNADESVLRTMTAAIANRLSSGFLNATNRSVQQILRELMLADIKINKEYVPLSHSKSAMETTDFTVVKTEGNYIYINAGRTKDVSIADLFNIMKKDNDGNMRHVAIYSVSKVEPDSSQLILIEPKGAQGTILIGDKAVRKTR
jgi:hypothetical protein